jgi:hypothetical protein
MVSALQIREDISRSPLLVAKTVAILSAARELLFIASVAACRARRIVGVMRRRSLTGSASGLNFGIGRGWCFVFLVSTSLQADQLSIPGATMPIEFK